MLSYVFMKILERRPRSYDRRMDRLSRGRISAMKEAVAAELPPRARILEIGCGTGELAARLARDGAVVEAFDLSPGMVALARERIEALSLGSRVSLRQMGVEGLDGLPGEAYGAVVSTLVLSELGEAERRFALKHAFRVLQPGGPLVIADEVVPRTRTGRLWQSLVRAPLVALTYLVSRTTTRPLADLSGEVAAAGFTVEKEVRNRGQAFALLVARRPKDKAAG